MSVRPVEITPTYIAFWHDEAGHGFEIPAKEILERIRFALHPDGSTDWRYVTIVCPHCGAVSMHPVGGGAAPRPVQKLFAHLYRLHPGHKAVSFTAAFEAARRACEEMDGPGRWRWRDMAEMSTDSPRNVL